MTNELSQAPNPIARRRRRLILIGAGAWTAVVFLAVWSVGPLDAKGFNLAIILAVGWGGWALIFASPDPVLIRIRLTACLVGLAGLAYAVWSITTGHCEPDGWCELELLNAATGEVVGFAIAGWAYGMFLASRRLWTTFTGRRRVKE